MVVAHDSHHFGSVRTEPGLLLWDIAPSNLVGRQPGSNIRFPGLLPRADTAFRLDESTDFVDRSHDQSDKQESPRSVSGESSPKHQPGKVAGDNGRERDQPVVPGEAHFPSAEFVYETRSSPADAKGERSSGENKEQQSSGSQVEAIRKQSPTKLH